ncbi:MAG: outer-membrane lipoprotein carrier protein LolA [bacterium]
MIAALLLAAAAISATVPAAGAPPSTAEEVLARVEAAESAIRDMVLTFRQETRLHATGDAQETVGELALTRGPERFRVRFTKPVSQTAVFDGKVLQLYLPDAGQAFRQQSSADDLARLIGLNPAAAASSFRRGYDAALTGCDAAGCTLRFTRTGERKETAWTVRVSASTWLLEEASFDNGEIAVVLKCSGYRINKGLPAKTFRLALPAGTDVQEGLPQLFGGPR